MRLEPASAAITGDLGEYVEVMPGTYTVSASQEFMASLETHVKFKVKKVLPAGKDVETISLDVLTADGMPVPGLGKLELAGFRSSSLDPLRAALKTGAGEVVLPLYMSSNSSATLTAMEAHQADAKKFAVTGALEEVKRAVAARGASSSAEDESGTTTSNSDKQDCDKFLTDFEQFVNSYATVAAKFSQNPADMSIMSEYSDMATKAQEMQSSKPGACEGDAAFMKRYLRITAKMTKAAAAQAAGSAKMIDQMSKLSQ